MTDMFISPSALGEIRGPLFYPAAGDDWNDPIRAFFPTVREFWFVDTSYFGEADSAERCAEVFGKASGFILNDVKVVGKPTAQAEQRIAPDGRVYVHVDPCTRSEYYRQGTTNELLVVHRHRGYGQRSIEGVPTIGVFFHRGDSPGESGSGVYWLSRRWSRCWLDRLSVGGLLATDGSLAHSRQLRRFHRTPERPEEAFRQAKPFTKWGYHWNCVGWVSQRYGPTLVWKPSRV